MEVAPFEVLEEILLHCADDKGVLFACAQVSWKWCQVAVPILWKLPCEPDISMSEPRFEVMLACLSDNERAKLGIARPEKRPLFNYSVFIRNIKVFDLDRAAHIYCSKNKMIASAKEIFICVLSCIFETSPTIETLSMFFADTGSIAQSTDCFSLPGAEKLSRLRTLSISGVFGPPAYPIHICQHLHTIKIWFRKATPTMLNLLSDFIVVQKALKSMHFDFLAPDSTQAVQQFLDAIATQQSTVEKVSNLPMCLGHFPVLERLAAFPHLTHLSVGYLKLEDADAYWITEANAFKQLTFLDLKYAEMCDKALEAFIKTPTNLEELRIGEFTTTVGNLIADSCPNLKRLFATTFTISSLATLSNQMQLRVLAVGIIKAHLTPSEKMTRFATFLPSGVKQLVLSNYELVEVEALNALFQVTPACLESLKIIARPPYRTRWDKALYAVVNHPKCGLAEICVDTNFLSPAATNYAKSKLILKGLDWSAVEDNYLL